MNILIDINHPAHVHLLRNVYDNLIKDNHNVIVVVKDIPSATRLLDIYKIPYVGIGKKNDLLAKKGFDQLLYNWRLLKLVYKHKIDIGIGSTLNLAHVSKLSNMKSIILDDDDDAVEPLFVKYAHPFADVILSPNGTPRKSKKTIYVDSYHELSYLHPAEFLPDVNVIREIGLEEGDPFFILRFNAFKAYHDVGASGLSIDNKRKLIAMLEKKGKVFITTERNIDDEFKKYVLPITPEKIHSLIYYATMLVGDSQTMTSEAAVLGTPAIRCNTFVGRIHYLEEEEHKYNLTYGFLPTEGDRMFEKIEHLLTEPDLKARFAERRQKMLSEKIDYAKFLTWFIENYPESKKIMKENPEYQYRFK